MPRKSASSQKNSPAVWLAGALLLIIVAGAGAYFFFDWGYGEVSPTGYKFATALFSICNQQDDARLAILVEKLEQAKADEQLQPDETTWLENIVHQAQNGHWDAASKNARRLMVDQQKR